MNEIIESIITTGKTIGRNGEVVNAGSYISKVQGEAIFNLIQNNKSVLRTLEIGCANGVSSLYMCEALKNRENAVHTIIDPFQNTDWKGSGIVALERAGLKNYLLIEEKSEFALPQLLKEERRFDLIFVDGWHTFDHALVDCFYSNRLLETGGFLILDDADMPPIGKLAAYIGNYDCYVPNRKVYVYPGNFLLRVLCRIFEKVPISHNLRHRMPRWAKALFRKPRMIIFKKISADSRRWNWYRPF
jgi:predicted O-methyltransferase YrrM